MPSDLATRGCDLLFVYGTLRRGASHHHILKSLNAAHLGPATVAGELFDLGRFPGSWLIEPKGPGISRRRVLGELYRLQNPPHSLDVLDRYEGLQSPAPEARLFRRELACVRVQGGKTMQAWIYVLAQRPAAARLVPSGDYAKAHRG